MRNIRLKFVNVETHEIETHKIITDLYDDFSRLEIISILTDTFIYNMLPNYDLIEIHVSQVMKK